LADHKRWFKVWTTILDDPHFQELSLEDIGRWTLLGAMLASVGSRGHLASPSGARRLREVLRTDTVDDLKAALLILPNVLIEDKKFDNGDFDVIMDKWFYYQEDRTAAERVKRSRSKNRIEEEEKILPIQTANFERFWAAYPRKVGRLKAFPVWLRLKPPIEKVLEAIGKSSKSQDWIKEGGKFIPHPTTWLNGGRWMDDLTVVVQAVDEEDAE